MRERLLRCSCEAAVEHERERSREQAFFLGFHVEGLSTWQLELVECN